MLCDSTSGYCYHFDIYSGRDLDFEDLKTVWVASPVVLKLCQSIFDTGRTVYTDRYYTSPILAYYLSKVGLYFCVTTMTNRKGFPKTLIDPSQRNEQGSSQWQQCQTSAIEATRWMDKRHIYFVSTGLLSEHDDSFVTRHDKAGKDVRVKCTPAVQMYYTELYYQDNAMIGGVDVSDKMARLNKSRKTSMVHPGWQKNDAAGSCECLHYLQGWRQINWSTDLYTPCHPSAY